MFYVKTVVDGKTVEIDLYGEEIHTRCYNCGKEIQVDEELLRDLVSGEDFSFTGTSMACCQTNKPKLTRIK